MKFVEKGWGNEIWIHNSERYCGKLLNFVAGKRCSLHYHVQKHETFYLQSGRLVCVFFPLGDPSALDLVIMEPGDVHEIPPYTVHQMHALEDSTLIEVSTQHFEEDSCRLRKGD